MVSLHHMGCSLPLRTHHALARLGQSGLHDLLALSLHECVCSCFMCVGRVAQGAHFLPVVGIELTFAACERIGVRGVGEKKYSPQEESGA